MKIKLNLMKLMPDGEVFYAVWPGNGMSPFCSSTNSIFEARLTVMVDDVQECSLCEDELPTVMVDDV